MSTDPGLHVWKASDLQRHYRQLLDSALNGRALIQDRDHTFMVQPAATAEFRQALVEKLRDLSQLLAARQRFPGDPPEEWAALTPFPWISTLSIAEVDEFQRELMGAVLTVATSGDPSILDGILAAWQSTAEIYLDPELVATLTVPLPAQLHEVLPPASAA